MRIGVPREKKPGEGRVGLTPAAVATLVGHGHAVNVERDAGRASGFDDARYREAGASVVDEPSDIFDADLVVKVKELQRAEYEWPKRDSIVIGFQQFAVEPAYLAAARASGASFIACETLEPLSPSSDALPVLAAMSRLAGTLAVHVGATALLRGLLPQTRQAAPGILLADARVLVIGAGASGGAAARAASAAAGRAQESPSDSLIDAQPAAAAVKSA